MMKRKSKYSNTSNVNLNLFYSCKAVVYHLYSNTSNVNLNPAGELYILPPVGNSNTSNVNLNQKHGRCTGINTSRIQIHLMLILIMQDAFTAIILSGFKYI